MDRRRRLLILAALATLAAGLVLTGLLASCRAVPEPTPDTPAPGAEATSEATATPLPPDTSLPPATPRPTVDFTAQPTREPTTPPPADPTPEVDGLWHGVVRSPEAEWETMRDQLGAAVVELLVKPTTSDAAILGSLDHAQALGLQVLFHIYDSSTNTDVPWAWDGKSWSITPRGAEILAVVEGHPAIWAVYCLEEPFDFTSEGYVNAGGQRAMVAFLRQHTSLPLYSDLSTMRRAQQVGMRLSDGMCDKCCVAPTNWGRGLDASISRADAEFATWQRTMNEAQLIFMVNVYGGAGHRMPTAGELAAFRDHACSLGVPVVYYPWTGYEENLGGASSLWSVVAEGCD